MESTSATLDNPNNKITVKTSINPIETGNHSLSLPPWQQLEGSLSVKGQNDKASEVAVTSPSKHLLGNYFSGLERVNSERVYNNDELRSVYLYFEGLEGRVRRARLTNDCRIIDLRSKAQALFGKFLTAVAAGDFYMVRLFNL